MGTDYKLSIKGIQMSLYLSVVDAQELVGGSHHVDPV